MTNSQLVLKFPHREDFSAENFVELGCHTQALAAVNGFPQQPGSSLVLYGPSGCGKTHLLNLWCEKHRAGYLDATQADEPPLHVDFLAVDNLQNATMENQEALFHFFNHMKSRGGAFLLASDGPVADMEIIPELKSRLLTGQNIELAQPQAEDLKILLAKWAYDRQLHLTPDVVKYVVTHAERSPSKLQALVDQLDVLSLAEKRKITIPLAKRALLNEISHV